MKATKHTHKLQNPNSSTVSKTPGRGRIQGETERKDGNLDSACWTPVNKQSRMDRIVMTKTTEDTQWIG